MRYLFQDRSTGFSSWRCPQHSTSHQCRITLGRGELMTFQSKFQPAAKNALFMRAPLPSIRKTASKNKLHKIIFFSHTDANPISLAELFSFCFQLVPTQLKQSCYDNHKLFILFCPFLCSLARVSNSNHEVDIGHLHAFQFISHWKRKKEVRSHIKH